MIKSSILLLTRVVFYFRSLLDRRISYDGSIDYFRCHIRLAKGARLSIGNHVTLFHSTIDIGPGSRVEIGDHAVIKNAKVSVGADSAIELRQSAVIRYDVDHPGTILLEHGSLQIDHHANIACSISQRFNSKLKIGAYTGLGSGTEIVCDRQIGIGEYCLISTDVDIYDTNSHSTDHHKRRDRIAIGYPTGCSEIEPPDTAAITIGDDVWIGKRSIILKGSSIGSRSIVGMGTKVSAGTYAEDSIIISDKAKALSRPS